MKTSQLQWVVALCVVQVACMSCETQDGAEDSAPDSGKAAAVEIKDRGDFVTEWQPTDTPLQEAVVGALREGRLFEELATALNQTLKLPSDLPIVHRSCGEENAFYDPRTGTIQMCHELLEKISTLAAQGTSDEDEVGNRVVATWLFVFFHELGHGLIDLYDLPVTGKEEDAVDDFSTVLLTEAGAAEFAIRAAEYWALTDEGMYDALSYADEHSLNPQRFFSILCTVYGSDPDAYEAIVTEGYLPESRASRCPAEYTQKLASWSKLLEPWSK